jgi:hypothetical protein
MCSLIVGHCLLSMTTKFYSVSQDNLPVCKVYGNVTPLSAITSNDNFTECMAEK